jgi:hypothetical protein
MVAALMAPSAEAIDGTATSPAAAMAPMAARRSMLFKEVVARCQEEGKTIVLQNEVRNKNMK